MSSATTLYTVRCRTQSTLMGVAVNGYRVPLEQAEQVIAELMSDHDYITIALYEEGTEVITDLGVRFFFLEQFLSGPEMIYRLLSGKQYWCCCDEHYYCYVCG